eukprot:COSAG05_NODE_1586_length_4483_cov_100.429745_1_plen_67_part_00
MMGIATSTKSDLTRVRHLQNSTAKCMQESGRHDRPICHTTAQYSGYMHKSYIDYNKYLRTQLGSLY